MGAPEFVNDHDSQCHFHYSVRLQLVPCELLVESCLFWQLICAADTVRCGVWLRCPKVSSRRTAVYRSFGLRSIQREVSEKLPQREAACCSQVSYRSCIVMS